MTGLRAPREDHQEMEKKMSKNYKKSYDTPEETTKFVLNCVADEKMPALDDAKNVRVNMDHQGVVRQEEEHCTEEPTGGGSPGRYGVAPQMVPRYGPTVVMSHHYQAFNTCKLSSATAIPPGVPVETFSYG
ncbi:hypothetical protein H072_4930 [Dactylellina haptotyla CBS 200.50]|uniref:Uncharacterized protein n=1 Tax=Dactylellina haptotyla (strain CBS 200.50) TaxID=1284197 RepID=S8C0N2_DACHA|nr:hypothetical protein H072_4930 [Dactylellina haptotyla CBS 200.50]